MLSGAFMVGFSLSCVLCTFAPVIGQHLGGDFPGVELSNGIIKLNIYLPDPEKGYYRGTRFDWSGVISQVEFKGHTYFGEWKTNPHDPTNHDDIAGPVEEFRTGPYDKPGALGYLEAKPGEPFIKIGIGLLEKIEEPSYNFGYSYKIIRPGTWEVTKGKDWIKFQQDFKGINGWNYLYTKKISLKKDSPEFVISHSLKNTGTRQIETSQYNHNFFIIDKEPAGTNYVLRFPFDVKTKRDMKGALEAKGKELTFTRNLEEGSLFTELEGFKEKDDYEITVENKRTGAGVNIKGDRPLVHFNFWTIKATVCPEPFVEVNLAPGEQKEWSINYKFFSK